MTTTGLNESDRRKVQHAINVTRAQYSERQPRRARWGGVGGGIRMRVGILDESLSAPSSITGTPETADVSHYTYDSDAGTLTDSGDTDEITNFDPSLQGGTGALVWYTKWSGIYVPLWVGCIDVNEVQTITITGTPTGGTFLLAFQGSTTSALDYDFTAAEVQAALEALPSIGSGNVSCTGGPLPGTAIDVEFQGDLAATNVGLMLKTNSLTGGTSPEVNVEVDTEGCCG